jgi:hypothetical protein
MTRRAVALLLGLVISIDVQAQSTTHNTTPLAYRGQHFKQAGNESNRPRQVGN